MSTNTQKDFAVFARSAAQVAAVAVVLAASGRLVDWVMRPRKLAINSADAPAPIGPYSQSVRAGDTLYMSGQIGMDPHTGELVGDVQDQARQALRNMVAVLAAAGMDMQAVVKCTVLLTTMDDFGPVNEVYAEFFQSPFPARAAFAVKTLPKNALVEIEAVATL